MTRLLPNADRQQDLPPNENVVGSRVFRVTDRQIAQRTRLILAKSPEDAIRDDDTQVSEVARQSIHEIVECVELIPQGPLYTGMPEDRP